jgi:hypothetical protein
MKGNEAAVQQLMAQGDVTAKSKDKGSRIRNCALKKGGAGRNSQAGRFQKCLEGFPNP